MTHTFKKIKKINDCPKTFTQTHALNNYFMYRILSKHNLLSSPIDL